MSSTYFAKVFDKDDHGILLHKLRALGIDGLLRRWIHSFLMDRTQRISIQGELSDQSEVQSEVPQGWVLGPLLFIIHIGNIDSHLEYAEASSFADDTRIKNK